jgi:ABC-type glutathione transport system ATPase component
MSRSNPPQGEGRFALEAVGLSKTFRGRSGFGKPAFTTTALVDVSIELAPEEILAVVGESGSGKTTLGRVIVGLEKPDRGAVRTGETTFVDTAHGVFLPAAKRGIDMIFQDPSSSLNPRMRVREIIAEGLMLRGAGRRDIRDRCAAVLDLVGLRRQDLDCYPHQFSGGQRQRIGIARAIVLEPRILVADEAVSSLDLSVQIQVLNVILDIRDKLGIAIIFITHNIGVVEYLCDKVVVLSKGMIVERGLTSDLINAPKHPYTKRLLAAVPRL